MTDQLLGLLRFVLLGALYAFFARVLWAVWTEVRVPAMPRSGPSAPGAPVDGTRRIARRHRVAELRVVSPKRWKGHTIELGESATVIGRSPNADFSVDDDSYLSNTHARVRLVDGAAIVEDLASTNGTVVNGERIEGSIVLRPGDRIQMGSLVVEAER